MFCKIKFMFYPTLNILCCQQFVLPADGMVMPKHVACISMCSIDRNMFRLV
jgi:hypothetical protein